MLSKLKAVSWMVMVALLLAVGGTVALFVGPLPLAAALWGWALLLGVVSLRDLL